MMPFVCWSCNVSHFFVPGLHHVISEACLILVQWLVLGDTPEQDALCAESEVHGSTLRRVLLRSIQGMNEWRVEESRRRNIWRQVTAFRHAAAPCPVHSAHVALLTASCFPSARCSEDLLCPLSCQSSTLGVAAGDAAC